MAICASPFRLLNALDPICCFVLLDQFYGEKGETLHQFASHFDLISPRSAYNGSLSESLNLVPKGMQKWLRRRIAPCWVWIKYFVVELVCCAATTWWLDASCCKTLWNERTRRSCHGGEVKISVLIWKYLAIRLRTFAVSLQVLALVHNMSVAHTLPFSHFYRLRISKLFGRWWNRSYQMRCNFHRWLLSSRARRLSLRYQKPFYMIPNYDSTSYR